MSLQNPWVSWNLFKRLHTARGYTFQSIRSSDSQKSSTSIDFTRPVMNMYARTVAERVGCVDRMFMRLSLQCLGRYDP